jgi:hypothetical protein
MVSVTLELVFPFPHVQFSACTTPKSLNQLPELKLNHLKRLTDDTGRLRTLMSETLKPVLPSAR